LEYSIAKHSRARHPIFVYSGTTGEITRDGAVVFTRSQLAPVQGQRFATEFSLFRYVIPELCGFVGRAIYLDSDMVCLADIGELAATALPNGAWFAARKDAHPEIAPGRHALSVMVMDCARCRFDLPAIFRGITERRYTYTQFSQMAPEFLRHFDVPIARLEDCWNHFDFHDETTKLIHYTDLQRQPWKFRHHPYGQLWHDYLDEAMEAGYLAEGELEDAIVRGHVRTDIRRGPRGAERNPLAPVLMNARLAARNAYRWAGYRMGWLSR
jgi:hypothetical protein